MKRCSQCQTETDIHEPWCDAYKSEFEINYSDILVLHSMGVRWNSDEEESRG